ncbi:hypothetical protein YC2023_065961 [Brassica napus]
MLSGRAVEHQMKRLAFVVSPTTAIPPPTTAVTVFKSLVDATAQKQSIKTAQHHQQKPTAEPIQKLSKDKSTKAVSATNRVEGNCSKGFVYGISDKLGELACRPLEHSHMPPAKT